MEPVSWSFDADRDGQLPTGFEFARTGTGAIGLFVVRAAPDAPSLGNVLAQTDTDSTDFRFPIAVASQPMVRDGRLSVRCKVNQGRVDQACGLVFRYADANNYYVVRANALENNVRLYAFKDGKRKQFGEWDGAVAARQWHTLELEARAERFIVRWEGKPIIDARDSTFPNAGKVGVWTKADSVTWFDELKLVP
jgi:hypothetical protein